MSNGIKYLFIYTNFSCPWDDIMVDSNAVTHCVSEPESCFPGMSESV